MGDVAARLPPQYRTVGVRAFAPVESFQTPTGVIDWARWSR